MENQVNPSRNALIFLNGAVERYAELVNSYINVIKTGNTDAIQSTTIGMEAATKIQRAVVKDIARKLDNGDV
jgi:hypothetical protein